jgi:hypothetical protein
MQFTGAGAGPGRARFFQWQIDTPIRLETRVSY